MAPLLSRFSNNFGLVLGKINLSFSGTATGGTITTVSGKKIHTFTGSGSFVVASGRGNVDIVAIGAGGGGGGIDLANPGSGGAGGGASIATFNITPGTYTVSIGGGGGGGVGDATEGSGGGTAGSNGGGTGGNAGPSNYSGGGGGGGGWSGFHTPTLYYVVGGGGAGGGGGGEGSANETPARGGGSPANSYRPDSTTGTSGLNFPGDGGGFGGCGGGVSQASGGAGGGSGNQSGFGGSNFANPVLSAGNIYAGGDGGAGPNGGPAGSVAPGFIPANPFYSPLIPAPTGNGGAQNGGTGGSGIVIIAYPL